ncbi:MAG: YqhA family protein [Cyanobacteria bacterium P01_F01_bin.53]
MRLAKKVEAAFELMVWNCRFFVLLPVVFSLLSAVKLFMMGTLDILAGVMLEFDMGDPEGEITYQIVSYVIGGIDYYLIGIVLLLFSFGVYELFISEIDTRLKHGTNILKSESLEDLKGKLVKVIVVALIVSLFKNMLGFRVEQASDFIYVALAIFLISVSSYLLQLQYKLQHGKNDE